MWTNTVWQSEDKTARIEKSSNSNKNYPFGLYVNSQWEGDFLSLDEAKQFYLKTFLNLKG